MNPGLRNLVALQDIELKIAGLQKQVLEIPAQIQGFEEQLKNIEAEYQKRENRLKEQSNYRRSLEGEVDMLRSKLSRLKDQLMAVKTNKEYTAMLHEIQAAEGDVRVQEDKILDVMEQMEEMEKDLKIAEREMFKKRAEIKESIQKTNESTPLMESDLVKLREEKAQIESLIDPELLSRYRRIAEARHGVALAEAKDEICTACHVRIRPQMYAELLSGENIYTCDSCSRILYSRENL